MEEVSTEKSTEENVNKDVQQEENVEKSETEQNNEPVLKIRVSVPSFSSTQESN